MTDPDVIAEFIDWKTEDAINALRGIEVDFVIRGDRASYEEVIDIGDNCWVKVTLEDRAANAFGNIWTASSAGETAVTQSQSGHITHWVPYGSRKFDSSATVFYGIASATSGLENYYTASANGVTLNYGIPYSSYSGLMHVSHGSSATITTQSATQLNSTAKMYALYEVTYGYAPIEWGGTYRMNSNIKFLQNDPIDNEIHITCTWDYDSM
jgi:hypothetical protein